MAKRGNLLELYSNKKNTLEALSMLNDKELAEIRDNEEKNRTKVDEYFDLFLEISKDINKDVVLKGNILLNKLLPSMARSTDDLDFSIYNKHLYTEIIEPKLIEFADRLIKLGKADSYEIKEEPTNKKSGGIVARLNNQRVFAVDVSLMDRSINGCIQYKFSGKYIYGSSIEKIMADKVLATLSTKRFRRIKDFYDLNIILSSNMSFSYQTILDLMIDKLGKDKVDGLLKNYPFDEITLSNCSKAWDKLSITSLLGYNLDQYSKVDFSYIYQNVSRLYIVLKSKVID